MLKKRRSSKSIHKIVPEYRNLLLFDLTGGSMGAPPKEGSGFKVGMTASEKKGVYDSLLKEMTTDLRLNPEEEESVFDTIKRNKNVSETGGSEEDS